MKVKKFVLISLSLLAIVLEALPYGAILIFAPSEGEKLRQSFSYFNPITFGYANFGPFLTAFLTIVLFALCIVKLFKENKLLNISIVGVSALATITSLLPLISSGIEYFSILGGLISAVLVLITIVSISNKNNF